MKREIKYFILFFVIVPSLVEAQVSPAVFDPPTINASDVLWNSINQNEGIEDGWYLATVKYTNYSTGTNSTYTLNVAVRYDKVITIDFGNGGSVHTGYNNEGYTYSGGSLDFDYDSDRKIVAATTTVTIYDSDYSTKYFKIIIE